MATFTIPKVWAYGAELTSTDLNALVAAIAASLNSISDSQVGASANIDGSKLADAPNGIPGGKVQAGAILQSKLAAGASDVGVTSSESYSAGTKAANPGPTTIATAARTVLGGSVILLATCTVELTHTDTGLTAVSARIKRDGSAISTDVQASASGPVNDIDALSMTVFFVDTGQTGSKTWTLEVQRASGNATVLIRDWQLFAWELT